MKMPGGPACRGIKSAAAPRQDAAPPAPAICRTPRQARKAPSAAHRVAHSTGRPGHWPARGRQQTAPAARAAP
eukprot:6014160-Lingulodinium_polyedra.AAC.1